LCASQLITPDTAGTSLDAACNFTDTRSSQPNQASRTPDSSYLLVSSTSFPSSSHISFFLVHHSTIIAEHKAKSSLSISPCHDHELTLSTAYTEYKNSPSKAYTEYSIHRVEHTPSAAYTEYGIQRVQHTPSTACIEYSIPRVQHTPGTATTDDCVSSL